MHRFAHTETTRTGLKLEGPKVHTILVLRSLNNATDESNWALYSKGVNVTPDRVEKKRRHNADMPPVFLKNRNEEAQKFLVKRIFIVGPGILEAYTVTVTNVVVHYFQIFVCVGWNIFIL